MVPKLSSARQSQSQARSKLRPAYPDAVCGQIIALDRGRARISAKGQELACAIASRLKGEGLAVGDRVRFIEPKPSGSLGRVVEIKPRRNCLQRTAESGRQKLVAANLDRLAVVVAVIQPKPSVGFVDRVLAAAFCAGIEPLLCMTKTDLAPAKDFLSHFETLGLATLELRPEVDLSATLYPLITQKNTLLFGQSGVGKSTLVNRLIPRAYRAVGGVNQVTGKGRHTSSSVLSLPLPGGGRIIDAPGVRGFGLGGITNGDLIAAFADVRALAKDCPRKCDHREPDCALVEAVQKGQLSKKRLLSLQRLLKEIG